MQDNSWSLAICSSWTAWRGETGCRPSWAGCCFPSSLSSVPQAQLDVQYSSGCGWSLAVLWHPESLGNLSPAAPKANMAGGAAHGPLRSNAGRGASGRSAWARARPRALRAEPGSLGAPRSCLPVALDALDAALTRHRWPAPTPARSSSLRSYLCTPARVSSLLCLTWPGGSVVLLFTDPRLPSVRCPPHGVCGPGLCSLPRFQWLAGDRPRTCWAKPETPGRLWLLPNIQVFSDRFHPPAL